jgi:hypothetical protein
MNKSEKLLDKCEAMTLLCSKASTHWSFIKFCFAIPLVLTSSAMCIINSISEDANSIKIPNIIVNAVSVLIMSLTNSIKASEKFEIFKKLSQQFMLLSQEIESHETTISKENFSILLLKYDNLIQDCSFEEIPLKYKTDVAKCFNDANRYIPIQLNGIIGNVVTSKRQSKDSKEMLQGIIQGASFVNISNIPPKELKTDQKIEENIPGHGESV